MNIKLFFSKRLKIINLNIEYYHILENLRSDSFLDKLSKRRQKIANQIKNAKTQEELEKIDIYSLYLATIEKASKKDIEPKKKGKKKEAL